jgi:SAM-dependent methyltransferase
MSPSSGYDSFPLVAEFYDHIPPYRDRRDVDFYVRQAQDSGGPVLELGCGTGRILIPTARAGVDAVGLDSSTVMLAVCRRKLSHEPAEVQSNVRLVEGSMTGFDLGQQFQLVTIPFRPFQHLLTVEDQCSCLSAIRRHLRPGGKLVFDIFNPSLPHLTGEKSVDELMNEPEFTMPDGRRVQRHFRVVSRDLPNQTQEIEIIYEVMNPDGHEGNFTQRFRMRYLFRFEAEHLLARSGFDVEAVYSDFDGSLYGSKYPGELIFIARKIRD